jgi:hypothetical protein
MAIAHFGKSAGLILRNEPVGFANAESSLGMSGGDGYDYGKRG